MPYTVLKGCWRNIIVLNVHAASEEKSDDSKDSFYEALGLSALLSLQTFYILFQSLFGLCKEM
jgi:hypothetical protein